MRNKNELSSAEKWEQLTFADNFIFCKVMEESPEICKKMLELLLDIKIDKIEIPKSEYSIKADFASKGIRLDVYVKDSTGRCFDIEIQTSIARDLALAKRARYYQGLMDVDNVFAGSKYHDLNETYVIFLCLGDVFGKGLPVYTFQNFCTENTEIKMNDGTFKIFFNAKMYDTMKSQELRLFFKYLCGKKTNSDFTDKISAIVERIKRNARWRHDYMFLADEIRFQADLRAREIAKDMAKDIAQDMAHDMAEDMAQNMAHDMAHDMAQNMAQNMAQEIAEEKTLETAKNLLDMNLSPENIAKATGLPLEKVQALQRKASVAK